MNNITCPNCGTEIKFNSNSAKLQKLKDAGIDISKFSFVTSPDNGECMVKWENGTPVIVNDEVFRKILDEGTIENGDIYRRHILAQIVRGFVSGNFTEWLHRKGYDYMWNMLEQELLRQASLYYHGNTERFKECNRWYNKENIIYYLEDYIKKLEKQIENKPTHTMKVSTEDGKIVKAEYKVIRSRKVFTINIKKEVLSDYYERVRRVGRASDPVELYRAVSWFNKNKIHLHNVDVPSGFVSDYKGYGAYFGMENLILFHGCRIHDENGNILGRRESFDYVKEKADEYKCEGWRLFGLLNKLINDNNFDFAAKAKEWRTMKIERIRELKKNGEYGIKECLSKKTMEHRRVSEIETLRFKQKYNR